MASVDPVINTALSAAASHNQTEQITEHLIVHGSIECQVVPGAAGPESRDSVKLWLRHGPIGEVFTLRLVDRAGVDIHLLQQDIDSISVTEWGASFALKQPKVWFDGAAVQRFSVTAVDGKETLQTLLSTSQLIQRPEVASPPQEESQLAQQFRESVSRELRTQVVSAPEFAAVVDSLANTVLSLGASKEQRKGMSRTEYRRAFMANMLAYLDSLVPAGSVPAEGVIAPVAELPVAAPTAEAPPKQEKPELDTAKRDAARFKGKDSPTGRMSRASESGAGRPFRKLAASKPYHGDPMASMYGQGQGMEGGYGMPMYAVQGPHGMWNGAPGGATMPGQPQLLMVMPAPQMPAGAVLLPSPVSGQHGQQEAGMYGGYTVSPHAQHGGHMANVAPSHGYQYSVSQVSPTGPPPPPPHAHGHGHGHGLGLGRPVYEQHPAHMPHPGYGYGGMPNGSAGGYGYGQGR